MNYKEIQTIRWIGITTITILVLNIIIQHRREELIREFGMYIQGAISCVAPTSTVQPVPPTLRSSYEN